MYDQTNFEISDINKMIIKKNISTNFTYRDLWWSEAEYALSAQLSVWAYLWGIVRYSNNSLVIRPKINLVANIGFGNTATHNISEEDIKFGLTEDIKFPLIYPEFTVPDLIADSALENFRVDAFNIELDKKKKTIFKKFRTKLHYLYLAIFDGP